MRINMKGALMAAAFGLGAVTVAHAAQPAAEATDRQMSTMTDQMPMAQGRMMSGERPMMNDPEMRARMSKMMRGCDRMARPGNRERMSNMRD